MPKPPSQQDRAGVWVSIAHRDKLNAAATRDGVTQREAAEALIELYHSGNIEVVKLVEAVVTEIRRDA